jgi:hypothetical protein
VLPKDVVEWAANGKDLPYRESNGIL